MKKITTNLKSSEIIRHLHVFGSSGSRENIVNSREAWFNRPDIFRESGWVAHVPLNMGDTNRMGEDDQD